MIKPQFFINLVEKICMAGSVVSLLAIMFFTTLDVLARKIMGYSIPSLFEITADYLMVALVYLSLSSVYVNGGHIRVTLFLERVPQAIRPVLDKVMELSALVLFVLIAIVGWNIAARAFQFNEVSSSMLAYPIGPALLLVPIGAGMLAIRIMQSLIFPQSIKKHQENAAEVDMTA